MAAANERIKGDAVEHAARSATTHPPAAPAVGGVVARGDLFGRLDTAGRVTVVSAPAGSGKTFLLRSWIGEAAMAGRAARVSVQGGERDPQRFWIAVVDALRATPAASVLVRPLTAAPDLDGWAVVERLLKDLLRLDERVWLVIDDVHQLAAGEALRQLELLVMRGPPELRFVLATRHDLRLGLHRLRLEGQLTEIRMADLRFTLEEARALFETAGVQLPEPALALLHERTEGWAAGLRLAALSLSGHPDPQRFAEEFSGSERTVADYLLAEVLERQPESVRRLLLRTSVLERFNGELADLLTGGSGGERALQDLEQAGAFVVSLDARRSWFRYHQMFADLLQLELRGTAPGEVRVLHRAAADWFAGHKLPVQAVRHAQAAEDWALAVRLLADHWVDLELDGRAVTGQELLGRFPASVAAADPELIAMMAVGELARGSLKEAERQLALAARRSGSVPAERRGRFQVMLTIRRLGLARQRGDLPVVAEEADRLLAAVEAPDAAQLGLGEDLRALALISLGRAEVFAGRREAAGRHLEQGVALARRIGRPYLEFLGLAHGAIVVTLRSRRLAEQQSKQAIELARRHGWGEDQAAGLAYAELGTAIGSQGRREEAMRWLDRAGQTLRAEAEPAATLGLHFSRWAHNTAHGRHQEALADMQAAERLADTLVTSHTLARPIRARMLQTLLRLGETERVETALAGLDEQERATAEMRITLAMLRLAQHDPQAAATALTPALDASFPRVRPSALAEAVLVEAIALDALGDQVAAGHALERALDLAEPDHAVLTFLFHPVPELLQRHARQRTAHAVLIADILSLLAEEGMGPGQGGAGEVGPSGEISGGAWGDRSPEARLREPLSRAETRVLHYLPTGLSVTEIADQLYLSVNTVRTHMRHIYDKLDTHRRHEVVERARVLGLLAPSGRRT
jgi:LuxR family maltose regulon positive regulatory protein